MAKMLSPNSLVFASFVLILQFFTNLGAQDIKATIKIDGKSPDVARVEGELSERHRDSFPVKLEFLQQYAGIGNLGGRVRSFLGAGRGEKWSVMDNASNHFAFLNGESWVYVIGLKPMEPPAAAAHLSWLTSTGGILTLDDLLPQNYGKAAKVKFDLPPDWKIHTTERLVGANEYDIADFEKAVFAVGPMWRERTVPVGGSPMKFVISGEWHFTDAETAMMMTEIGSAYRDIFGSTAAQGSQLVLTQFPTNVPLGNWEAGSRGRNITLISSDMPFKTQSLQRLHEQLRHELFHLWMPNGVSLSGNYDWFYEGFALYESLKTGVGVNRLRFEDFLDTLSRAYDIDAMQARKLSLIDASKNRWSGSNTQVYARGMLVAFLCDLALLEKSKGRSSVPTLLREIYSKHRPPNPTADGNAAIIAVLRSHAELIPIVERYILGAETLDWAVLLKGAGIDAENKDQKTTLKITAKLSGRQKDTLDKLGYNNWRKL